MAKKHVDLADLGLDDPLDVAASVEAKRIEEEAKAAHLADLAAEEQRLKCLAEQELRAEIAAEAERYKSIIIATSALPPGQAYEIIDTVFVIDSDGNGGIFARTGDVYQAFARVKERLREVAFKMRADAIINCEFDHRIFVAQNSLAQVSNQFLGTNSNTAVQGIEFFAYGTAVRLR